MHGHPPHHQVMTQPAFQHAMEVRNMNHVPVDSSGKRDWSHGCCSSMCDGCAMCCCATWCPCIAYGKIKSRVAHLERNNYPHPSGGDICTTDCWLHGCLSSFCALGWVLQIGLRSSIRNRYRIGGCGGCGDCWCSMCCTPCSLAQESLELELEEHALKGAGKF
ncbi:hypothetical protein SCHPADRAFT_901814 [Schizopora paradoxa]|uniref:PLAC8-domain-containing protein n=1 Tax=Schizopora paradoxa TaxID=27342 RepID=A0A0H2RVR2_9AGAM|nr:hypothetical protein SCHPADRAFT_901814 [Schizopora paradoxa]